MTGPPEAVLRSWPVSSLCRCAGDYNLCQSQPRRVYLPPATESGENLRLMRLIDEQFLKTPFYGSRRMTACLERSGETVNRKRVQRLMALMGLETLFLKGCTKT